MKKKAIKKSLAAVLCLAIVITGCLISEKNNKTAASIPEHNGEVLVDSLNISDNTSATKNETKKENNEKTELVTSDDISELEGDSYFQEMRATINLDRNEVISMLTDAEAAAENTSEKDSASQQKSELMENMQKEQEVESAIAAKGLPECLVLITENGVNVTVNKQELNDNDVAKICDIVMRETGRSASQIIIQSKF